MNSRNLRASTLADVARSAEVAVSTVSRFLSGDKKLSIRKETKDRIMQAVEHLDYIPNASARGLRNARSYAIGIIAPEMENPIFHQIILGAERAAEKRGYMLLIAHMNVKKLDQGTHRKLVLGSHVSGLLVTSLQDPNLLADLRRLHVPFVLINRETDLKDDFVVADFFLAAKMSIEYLVKVGHRRIALVSGPLSDYVPAKHLEGYKAGLKHAGIDYDQILVRECPYNRAGAEVALLDFLKLDNPPTAVVAVNIAAASGLCAEFQKSGLKVGTDLSVLTLSDGAPAEMLSPTLTAVIQPMRQIANAAASALIDKIEGKLDDPLHVVMPPEGIAQRESCKPLSTKQD